MNCRARRLPPPTFSARTAYLSASPVSLTNTAIVNAISASLFAGKRSMDMEEAQWAARIYMLVSALLFPFILSSRCWYEVTKVLYQRSGACVLYLLCLVARQGVAAI